MPVTPFVTVGIPTLDRATILPQTLRAVLNQSFQDFEIIISDNCSKDDTARVVAEFKDPRVRYFRHDQRIGAPENFNFLAREARGTFFVLNQDDDLLHRDFLKRCHECVAEQPDVVMYATPWWRGNSVQGFSGRIMRDRTGAGEEYVINDRPLLLDGKTTAVSLLHAFQFAHPALAFRTKVFQEMGGYYPDFSNVFDVITEIRLLCRGNLVYDPRVGAIFRDHPGNYSRGVKKQARVLASQKMFEQSIVELEAHRVDWKRILAEDLDGYAPAELLNVFSEWVRYTAPAALQEIGWKKMWQHNPRSKPWLWKKLLSRVGLRHLIRFARTRKRA